MPEPSPVAADPEARLPDGFVVALAPGASVEDAGRMLVGGYPDTVVQLSDEGAALIRDRRLVVEGAESAALARDLLDAGLAHPVAAELPPVDASELTVVIPVKDRPAELDRLLRSLGGMTRTIVVDDGSADPEATARVAAAHGAELVALPESRGPGAARNAGLREVTSRYVLFVDSDVVVDPGALLALARHFADPAVAVVLPRVLGLHEGRETNWLGRYENSRSSLDLGELPSFVHPGAAAPWAPGTCTIDRVEAIRDGFDETMPVGEDVDLVFRVGLRGWRTRYDPAFVVRHDHRTELRRWLARKTFYASSAHPLNARFPFYVVPSQLTPTDAGLLVAALAQRAWSLPAIAVLSAVSTIRSHRRIVAAGRPDADRDVARLRWRVSLVLTGRHLQALALHLASLLVRHWWPVTAVACLFSRRARRAALVAAILDAVVFHRLNRADLDLPRYAAARRLDDLAFGLGWWLGAWRGRSAASLLPDLRPSRPPAPRTRLARFVRAAR